MKITNRYEFLILVIILVLVSLLAACNSSEPIKSDNAPEPTTIDNTPKPDSDETEEVLSGINITKATFTGTIKEIHKDNKAIVYAKILKGNPEGDVFVNLAVNNTQTFEVGDKIKVEFDGQVLESNPAQINTLSVELIK